jgi:outer membrane lipoprotein-sorting protein
LKNYRLFWIIVFIFVLAVAGCSSEPAPEDETEVDDPAELLAKGHDLDNLSYDLIMEGPQMNFQGTFWIKNNKMKMEMTAEGQTSIMIINGETEEAFMYMPTENMAVRVPFDTSEEELIEQPTDFLDYDESLLDMGESVVYNGIECQKITVTGENPITMWVHKELGIPIRVEMPFDGGVMAWEYQNISTDPIPDEVFELPEGVSIIGA